MNRIIYIFFLLFFSTVSSQDTWYVTTTGSSSNDGASEGNAWTFAYAASTANPGDTVYIKAGDYGNISIVLGVNGTFDNPISFIGYKTTPGDIVSSNGSTWDYGDAISTSEFPTLTGIQPTNNTSGGTGINITGNYVYLENIQVRYYKFGIGINGSYSKVTNAVCYQQGNFDPADSGGFTNYSGRGINVSGTGNQLYNSVVYNAGAEAIRFSNCYDVVSSYNEVHSDNTVNPTDYYYQFSGDVYDGLHDNILVWRHGSLDHYGHGIGSKNNVQGNVVDTFTIYNTYLDIQYPQNYGNIYKNGTIIKESNVDVGNGNTTGIQLANGAHDNLFENITIKNAGIKFRNSGEGTTDASDNNIFNQVTVSDAIYGILFNYWNSETTNASADNNTWLNCTFDNLTYLFEESRENSGSQFTNCLFTNISNLKRTQAGETAKGIDATYTRSNFYGNGFAAQSGTNITTLDPGYTDAANDDYSITNASLQGIGDATIYLSAGNDLGAVQGGGGSPGDTTAPIPSGNVVSSITETSARIDWVLDEAGTRYIEYGLTAGYGSTTTESVGYYTTHYDFLTGLTSNTLYHYRLRGEDAAGNTYTSSDFTFTTASSEPGIASNDGVLGRGYLHKNLKSKKTH